VTATTSSSAVTRHVSRGNYVVSTASGPELSDSVLSITTAVTPINAGPMMPIPL